MDSLFSSIISCRELEYIVLDRSLKILEVSARAHQFSEFPEEIKRGNDIRLALPELCGVEEAIDSIGKEGCPNFKLKNIAKTNLRSSSICYVDLYIGCIPTAMEGESHILILLEDTTEQAIVQQNLFQQVNESSLLKTAWSESQEYLDKIINSMADSLLVTNWQGIIKKINPATREMFGYEEHELIDQSIHFLISHPEQLPLSNLESGFPNPEFLLDAEVNCITKTGQEIIVFFSCSRLQTTLTEIPDQVYLGKDITKRIQAEEKLHRALQKEKEINEFKSNFVSAISHKIRTPLNTLLLTSELLQDIKNNEQYEIINSMKSNVTTLIQVVRDIVLVNKTESLTINVSESSIDVTEVCQKIVRELQLSLGDSERLKFIQNDRVEAQVDLKILKYIFTQTIYSIIKYSSGNLEIQVKSDKSNEKILFEVVDSSCCISQEDRDIILSDRNTSKLSGFGLELAIIQKYVKIHGGRIELEREFEAGTVFRVVLPFLFCTIDDR